MMKWLIIIARYAQTYFPQILKESPIIFTDKVRLVFIDGSYMDIRYPVDSKYSFHWQMKTEIIRIDTAPHHRNISTYPRHMHSGTEENVIEDYLTEISNNMEDNIESVLNFVQEKLKK